MLWMLAAIIAASSVINSNPENSIPVINNPENVITGENHNIEEGEALPDGRIILLLSREDLAYATAIVQSEQACRAKLAECAAGARESEPKFARWLWLAGGLALGILAGFAVGLQL